jgi:hypothetical protein
LTDLLNGKKNNLKFQCYLEQLIHHQTMKMTGINNSDLLRVIADMIVGGVVALLQIFGFWILLLLVIGQFLSSLFDMVGTSETNIITLFFLVLVSLILILCGPILLSLYHGNTFLKATLGAIGASLISIPITLFLLFLFRIILRGQFLDLGSTINLTILAIPVYIVTVSAFTKLLGSTNQKNSWQLILAAVALTLVILLIVQFVSLKLLPNNINNIAELEPKLYISSVFFYALLNSLNFPLILRLVSKQYNSIWIVLLPIAFCIFFITLGIIFLSIST